MTLTMLQQPQGQFAIELNKVRARLKHTGRDEDTMDTSRGDWPQLRTQALPYCNGGFGLDQNRRLTLAARLQSKVTTHHTPYSASKGAARASAARIGRHCPHDN
jgi:hypothetical protein